LHIASEGLVIGALLLLAAVTAPIETLAASVVIIALLAAPLRVTRRLHARWGDEERQSGERMLARLQQSLDTLKQIIVTGRQDHFVSRYAAERHQLQRAKQRRMIATTALRSGIETIFICAMLFALLLLTMAGKSGPDALSVLGLFAYAGFRVV